MKLYLYTYTMKFSNCQERKRERISLSNKLQWKTSEPVIQEYKQRKWTFTVGKSQSWVEREVVVSVKSQEREKDYDNISLYEILKTEKNTTIVQYPQ